MARLSKDDVLKLARLARIELNDDEVDEFIFDLNEILAYVEQLQAVDTKGLSPTNQVSGLSDVMRPDELVDYGYQPAELLKNVPSKMDDQIKVRRMVD